MVDGLVERVRVPRAVSAVAAAGAAVALVVGLLGADPVERWHELKAPPDTQPRCRGRGLVTRHLTSTEGTGRYQFWKAGWEAFKTEPLHGRGRRRVRALVGAARVARLLRAERALPVRGDGGGAGRGGPLPAAGLLRRRRSPAGVRRRRAGEDRGGGRRAAGGARLRHHGGGGGVDLGDPGRLPARGDRGGAAVRSRARRRAGRGPAAARLLLGAGVVVIGCACIVAGGIALTSDAKLRASREAAADGDLAKAADEARAAAAIQPWAAAPRLQLALVQEEQTTRPRPSGRSARRSSARPEDWRLWFDADPDAGRTRATAPGALRALRRTRELAPPSPTLRGCCSESRQPPIAAGAAPFACAHSLA